jgi:ATP-dependent DNA helicase RecG
VPIYPETKGLTSKGIRYCIAGILEHLEDIPESMPEWLRESYDLPEINEALKKVHFPENEKEATYARERFVFEELLLMQLKSILERRARSAQSAYPIKHADKIIAGALKALPFVLTHAQKEALRETVDDMALATPMNRLIQGDVGAGKTIIAGLAALVTAENDKQVAIMAPTEILARQHYKTLITLFPQCEKGIGFLASKEARAYYGQNLESKIDKKQCLLAVKKGELKIVIGTHALLQKNLAFKNLALVVVDEQHRFGVAQRAELLKRYMHGEAGRVGKSKAAPHFLSMSATPIPRTLMIALYGDLDISLANELPKGRKAIITKVVDDAHRMNAYAFIRGQIQKGRQAFVICPRIDPVEVVENNEIIYTKDEQSAREVKTVSEEFERLQKKIFPDLRVAMLHGKMKSAEKEEIMQQFATGQRDILVATSVVEVGVDVPNATLIVIEGSDRFGLAQLYQLRGRVGRGQHQSFCMLFTASQTEKTEGRLLALCTAKTGFELAEKDLELRGPGEFLGSEQTGIPDTAMRALKRPELFKRARNAAEELLAQDEVLTTAPLLKQKLIAFEKEVHNE